MFHCKYGTSLLLFHKKILMFLQYTWEDPILPFLLSSLPAFPIQKGIFYPLYTSYNHRYSNSKHETNDKCFVTDLSLMQTITIHLSIFPLDKRGQIFNFHIKKSNWENIEHKELHVTKLFLFMLLIVQEWIFSTSTELQKGAQVQTAWSPVNLQLYVMALTIIFAVKHPWGTRKFAGSKERYY